MSFAPGEERTLAEKWRSSVLDVFLFFHTARHTNMSQNSQAVCCEKASTNDMLTALSHYNRGGTLFLFYFCIFFLQWLWRKVNEMELNSTLFYHYHCYAALKIGYTYCFFCGLYICTLNVDWKPWDRFCVRFFSPLQLPSPSPVILFLLRSVSVFHSGPSANVAHTLTHAHT